MPHEMRLKVVLAGPPVGYAFCLQRGKGAKGERLDYVEAEGGDIAFELTVQARERKRDGALDFGGPFVQGPPDGRFFYVCVGRCSTIAEPHWMGRVKVSLASIGWPLVREVREGGVLEAAYAASRADGRPVLASVPLLGDGWSAT